MRKLNNVLICTLFLLIIFCLLGTFISKNSEYYFEITNVYVIVVLLVSIGLFVLNVVLKINVENIVIRFLFSIITPISIINAVLCIILKSTIFVFLSMLASVVCCWVLAVKYGRPLILKRITIVLAVILLWPAMMFTVVFLGFGSETVVESIDSPEAIYSAELIEGGIGSDIFVMVYEKGGINVIFFKFNKPSEIVYHREFGKLEDLEVYWKDDNCLVINSVEYEIE